MIPQFLIKGFPPKEDPKLSIEGNKVHTLLKLFQGESSKQDSIKFEGVVFYKVEVCKIFSPAGLLLPRESKHGNPREKRERECGKLDKREPQWSTIYCDPPSPRISGETFHCKWQVKHKQT